MKPAPLTAIALIFSWAFPAALQAATPEDPVMGRGALPGNRLQMLLTGDELFKARMRLIEAARKSIYITAYGMYADGGPKGARTMLAALCRKAAQRVDVRLIPDHHGSYPMKALQGQLRDCGVRVILYNPPRWDLTELLYVTHEKLFIVDGEHVILGGSGYSANYHSSGRHTDHWYDFDVLVEGPAACWYHREFVRNRKWAAERDARSLGAGGAMGLPARSDRWMDRMYGLAPLPDCSPKTYGTARVAPLYNDPMRTDERPLSAAYERAVKASSGTIDLYSPYLVLPLRMAGALLDAAARGVKVRLLTNSPASMDGEGGPVMYATYITVEDLMKKGIEVYLWKGSKGTLHRKGGVFGGRWAYFGSDNLDRRGANYQTESIAFTDDPVFVSELSRQLRKDIDDSLRLTPELIREESESYELWRRAGTPFVLDLL